MRIYRGPASQSFDSDTHELVDDVAPEKLEEALKNGKDFSFNISPRRAYKRSVIRRMEI